MKLAVDLINAYSRLGNLHPECFHFLRLRTGLLIGLRGLSEEVVKLQGFLFVPGHQIMARGSEPLGDAPMRPFEVQLSAESVQKPHFPIKSRVLRC